jgi:putative phage-type endonuclease
MSKKQGFIETLTDSDVVDIVTNVYELTDEYYRANILQLQNPKFHELLAYDVLDTLIEEWSDAGLIQGFSKGDGNNGFANSSEELDIMCEFIENCIDDYFELGVSAVRSYPMASVNSPPDIGLVTEKIARLVAAEQPEQRTQAWYEFRHGLISASSLSKCFATEAQQNSLIYEKCKPVGDHSGTGFTNTSSPMHWGQRFEPVSQMIYQHMYNTKIQEFGCIRHRDHVFIGASPDGVNVDPESERYGRMLEIKNIVNRELTGVPKPEYWVQMQGQLEVCDLEECDFLETVFKEYDSEEALYKHSRSDCKVSGTKTDCKVSGTETDCKVSGTETECGSKGIQRIPDCNDSQIESDIPEYRGVILYFVQRVSMGDISSLTGAIDTPHYEYMPLSVPIQKDAVDAWIAETRLRLRREWSLYQTIYWYLDDYSCVTVPRNREWFAAALPKIQETWDIIVKERVEGYEHRAAKKRILKTEVVHGTDASGSQFIKNMPLTNSVCLVKLDHA